MKTLNKGSIHLQQKSQRACSAFGLTDRGRVRSGNEDSFLCREEEGIFVVCDGMGGAAAGEIASRLASENALAALVESFGESVHDAHQQAGSDNVGGEARFSESDMRSAVAAANSAVFNRAGSDRRLEGMGTTLVMLAVRDHRAMVAHVGDSRCYLLRRGTLQLLTTDHSLVEEQVRLGQITRRQAERSALQHVITRAIGTAADVMPDVLAMDALAGDIFLLTSDGLTKELKEEELAALLGRSASEQSLAQGLVQAANLAGGRDNITCVVVRVL
jgi:serine/threonine protein phosphatase PrpC